MSATLDEVLAELRALRLLVVRERRSPAAKARRRTPQAAPSPPPVQVSDVDRARAIGILRRNGLAR